MRSILELLKILLEHINTIGMSAEQSKGLCSLIYRLDLANIISKSEGHKISNYIYENKPNITYFPYFWEQGMREPRIKWLKEQIEKLENENKN